MSSPTSEPRPVKNCHVCQGARICHLFSSGNHHVVRCEDCGLVFLNPQPSDDELDGIYSADYCPGGGSEAGRNAASEIRRATAGLYLSEIRRYRGAECGRLLEVGCGEGDLLVLAEAEGWQVTGVELSPDACKQARQRLKRGEVWCGELQSAQLAADQFDLCVISHVLQNVRSPLGFLKEIHCLLKPGGALFVATPSMDSWSASFRRRKGMEFKAEHLTYFDRQTLQTALFKSGFRDVIVQPGWKFPNLDCTQKHFERFSVPLAAPLLNFASRMLPQTTRLRYRRMVAGGVMAFSRKVEQRAQPVLSVIVPAYNEAKTFDGLMESLLRKEITGLRTEIIVVESNSTDGTRAAALKYKDHPKVKLILEEQPRGKGRAVRTGLQTASGDYVLIQDADLEYDLEDYDALLEHLISGRSAFVLGSRHGGRGVMKMRQFAGQRGLSFVFNSGHWFFTMLINVLFFQRLRDPFTMFKVFRRDCLCGLEFECNRFDFDFELLVKLIRKGYRPAELPVNYRSRSFQDGKKVRMFRDPLSWLKVLVWLRCVKIDPMSAVERARRNRGLE